MGPSASRLKVQVRELRQWPDRQQDRLRILAVFQQPPTRGAVSRLESAGLMREMSARLAEDPELAARYQAAHERYLRRREEIEAVPEIAGVSAGGMPTRVKCLHVLAGQSLGMGRGVNPLGDEVVDALGEYSKPGPCA